MVTTTSDKKTVGEACVSCGAMATYQHPMVAIVSVTDVAPDRTPIAKGERFAAVPVCNTCWRNPDKRPVPIKGHFFSREQAEYAVERAGADTIG